MCILLQICFDVVSFWFSRYGPGSVGTQSPRITAARAQARPSKAELLPIVFPKYSHSIPIAGPRLLTDGPSVVFGVCFSIYGRILVGLFRILEGFVRFLEGFLWLLERF